MTPVFSRFVYGCQRESGGAKILAIPELGRQNPRPTLVLPDRLIATTVGFGNITPLAFVDRIQMAVVVPEPSTLLLIALGGLVLFVRAFGVVNTEATNATP